MKAFTAPKRTRAARSPYERVALYRCDHYGKYTAVAKGKENGGRTRDASIKVGCPARYVVSKKREGDGFAVDYHWKHEGHEIGSAKHNGSRIQRADREWLDKSLARGIAGPTILSLAHPEKSA